MTVKPRTNSGYMFGLRRSKIPVEPIGRSMFGSERMPRMAGDLLDINLVESGVSPLPFTRGDALRSSLTVEDLTDFI